MFKAHNEGNGVVKFSAFKFHGAVNKQFRFFYYLLDKNLSLLTDLYMIRCVAQGLICFEFLGNVCICFGG